MPSVKHKFVSSIPDGTDTSVVRPSNWNDDHDLVGVAESGANTDITSMTGITGGISSPNYIGFDTTYATPLTAGQLGWDGNNTLAIGMAGGNVIQHIGEDSYFYIKASSAITKGQLIMFTGAVGASGVLTGAPSTGVTVGSYIMGVAAEDIANNGFGLVQCFGELTGVNTNSFNEGDILYYDSAVAGGLTSTFPTSGPIVQVAAVAKKSAGSGVIYIRVSVTQRITAGTGASVSQTSTGTSIAVANPYDPAAVAITGGTISGTRINPRVYSTTSTATLAVNSDSYDQAVLTAQAASLAVSAPTGTPVNGQRLTLRFKDNGTAQAISWTITSGGFRVIGCTLPTTTVISKTVYIGCIYNSNDTFWDVVSVAQQI